MAVRYHLKEDGMPGTCTASIKDCPRGDDAPHFTNKADALAAAEEKLREENNYLASSKKHEVFHISENGSVDSCRLRDGECNVKAFGKLNNVHSSNRSVIVGAINGMKAVMGGSLQSVESSPPAKSGAKKQDITKKQESEKEAPAEETETTRTAREILGGTISPWDQKRLDQGWTAKEIKQNRDSCGHWIPSRLDSRPTSIYGC